MVKCVLNNNMRGLWSVSMEIDFPTKYSRDLSHAYASAKPFSICAYQRLCEVSFDFLKFFLLHTFPCHWCPLCTSFISETGSSLPWAPLLMSTFLLSMYCVYSCGKSFAPIPPLPLGEYWQVFNFPLSIQCDGAWMVAAPRVVMVTIRACLWPPTDFAGTFPTLIYLKARCAFLRQYEVLTHNSLTGRNWRQVYVLFT